ncbi:hypothetical protein ALC56_04093 [Trachymyrmex septentrionalis]|uniref:Uncharacterized protein n=1 Tax=Trachymyrmex septentrionalis TaxID=34720 RepID=A0A151JYF9_9HYME|nr:hypothetical protein ALC56_04093 [Trachymyrmex septentrionalis]
MTSGKQIVVYQSVFTVLRSSKVTKYHVAVQITHFSREYEEWPAFRDFFTSLIVKDTAFSDVIRMYYLKTSLKREVKLIVRNLPSTNDNFALVWKSLADHYENKRLLVCSFYSTLWLCQN